MQKMFYKFADLESLFNLHKGVLEKSGKECSSVCLLGKLDRSMENLAQGATRLSKERSLIIKDVL